MDEVQPDSEQTRRLLDQAQAGDRHAFEQLFARYQPYLQRVVALRIDPRLRTRLDPGDIVQETQLEAFRRLPDFCRRRPMPFRLWLRKTAQQRLLMARREHLGARRRAVGREVPLPEESSLQLLQQFLAPGSTPSKHLVGRELAGQVRQAMAELSEADREILLLRNLELLSNHEAAGVLGIEPAAASQRYGRALIRLRKLLVTRGLMESDP